MDCRSSGLPAILESELSPACPLQNLLLRLLRSGDSLFGPGLLRPPGHSPSIRPSIMAAVDKPAPLDLKSKLLSHPVDVDVDMEARALPSEEPEQDL